MKFHTPKGLFDLLPSPSQPKDHWKATPLWNFVESLIRKTARQFAFEEIRTPLFEETGLFQRGVGESSDIVSKEMYTFLDRAKRSLTLRPEGTAPVMRSVVEHHLQGEQKLFYLAPMFRYERPQSGRYRQHHQFGVEALGNPCLHQEKKQNGQISAMMKASIMQDIEVIDLLWTTYQNLKLEKLSLHINSVGDQESRQNFRQALKNYLKPYFHDLSQDSQQRFENNPLRILDSKDPQDKKILEEAPRLKSCLNCESKNYFEQLLTLLESFNIPFTVNDHLVRGLDYYNHTVFEVVCGSLGAQNSIGGGGRYDGLIKSFGGPDTPGVGFGTGLERIIQTALDQEKLNLSFHKALLYWIPLGEQAQKEAFHLVKALRDAGLSSEMDFSGRKLSTLFKQANQRNYPFVSVLGSDELESQVFSIKEMTSGETHQVKKEHLISFLKSQQTSII